MPKLAMLVLLAIVTQAQAEGPDEVLVEMVCSRATSVLPPEQAVRVSAEDARVKDLCERELQRRKFKLLKVPDPKEVHIALTTGGKGEICIATDGSGRRVDGLTFSTNENQEFYLRIIASKQSANEIASFCASPLVFHATRNALESSMLGEESRQPQLPTEVASNSKVFLPDESIPLFASLCKEVSKSRINYVLENSETAPSGHITIENQTEVVAKWLLPFAESNEGLFRSNNSEKRIRFLVREGVFRRAMSFDREELLVQFKDSDLVLRIVVPNEENFEAVEQTFLTDSENSQAFTEELLEFRLPQIQLHSTISLNSCETNQNIKVDFLQKTELEFGELELEASVASVARAIAIGPKTNLPVF